ncbi:MAG: integrase core domain-containing protein [Candidatus Hodarchaeales archaeon]
MEALQPFKSKTIVDVQKRLYRWRNWYNFHRRHMGIGNRRPAELFHPYHARYGR